MIDNDVPGTDMRLLRERLGEICRQDSTADEDLVEQVLAEIAPAVNEAAVLRAALTKYGQHDLGCRVRSWLMNMPSAWNSTPDCDCGLTALQQSHQVP